MLVGSSWGDAEKAAPGGQHSCALPRAGLTHPFPVSTYQIAGTIRRSVP